MVGGGWKPNYRAFSYYLVLIAATSNVHIVRQLHDSVCSAGSGSGAHSPLRADRLACGSARWCVNTVESANLAKGQTCWRPGPGEGPSVLVLTDRASENPSSCSLTCGRCRRQEIWGQCDIQARRHRKGPQKSTKGAARMQSPSFECTRMMRRQSELLIDASQSPRNRTATAPSGKMKRWIAEDACFPANMPPPLGPSSLRVMMPRCFKQICSAYVRGPTKALQRMPPISVSWYEVTYFGSGLRWKRSAATKTGVGSRKSVTTGTGCVALRGRDEIISGRGAQWSSHS